MHPSSAIGFEWDDDNEGHLDAHRITPWEAEEVYVNRPTWVPDRRHGSDRWKMIGFTSSGRALTVVVQFKANTGVLRPFTGWDCTTAELTRYPSKRRGRQ